MSTSNAITKEDLKNVLNEVLPSGAPVEDISSSFTFGSSWTPMLKIAYKIGNLVVFSLEGNAGTIIGGTQYTMATIASGYRPRANTCFTGHTTNSNYVGQGYVNAWAWTGGDFTIRTSNSNGQYVFVNGCYVI